MTEEEIRNHYKHKCNTGYDPLLCVHLTYYPIVLDQVRGMVIPRKDPDNVKLYRHRYYHIDQVITEDRYVELIQKTNSTLDDLGDYDILKVENIWVPTDAADREDARIFWLKPTSKCKTLTDLFNQYEQKIKILFGNK